MTTEHNGPRAAPSDTTEWENEGGAMSPPPLPVGLPEGVSARWTLEYRVGAYRYTSLAEAKAEQQRRDRMAGKVTAEAQGS